MENFVYHNPTKLIFGKDVSNQLGEESKVYGKKALIIIGKGSVKTNGILSKVEEQLKSAGIEFCLYEGIKSNPVYTDADAAATMAKAFGAEMIVAVGGGSVIDTAKGVSMAYYADHSVWDFYIHKAQPQKALPIISVLTLAATGTEMNQFTVLQNDADESKVGYASALLYPKVSFLDPSFTTTVSKKYTSYGVTDLIAHTLETFFAKGDAPLTDLYSVSVIHLAVQYGVKVMEHPLCYDTRANIMWLATNALNGTLSLGRGPGDWACHGLEHCLSALFDIPHGAGLSIVFPAWMKYNKVVLRERLAFLAMYVFGVLESDKDVAADMFISKLEDFFRAIDSPVRLQEYGITIESRQRIIDNMNKANVTGNFIALDSSDREKIVDLMFSA